MTAAATVTLQVWRLPPRLTPAALVRSRQLAHRLRRDPGVAFARVLGTAGPRFTPRDARPARWAALVKWGDVRRRGVAGPGATAWWDRHAAEAAVLRLAPVSSHGSWNGASPFAAATRGGHWDGPVLVLTRATLRPRTAAAFYRAVAPTAADLAAAGGLTAAFGVGEAPLLRQGTVSLWRSAAAADAYLRTSTAHRDAVRRTRSCGWYREEMFTRFAVLAATGSIDGTGLSG